MSDLLLPPKTAPHVFAERRKRCAELVQRYVVEAGGAPLAAFGAGWARPRNFAHNVYPFRAESHFLYLVGQHIEGAILVLREGGWTLYVVEPEPEAELWHGRQPNSADWQEQLRLETRSVDELAGATGTPFSVLPPQDEESAQWLSEMLKRPVEAQNGPQLEGGDAALAQVMVALRLVHDEAGMAQLRYAATLTAGAHRAGMRACATARTEQEVRGVMEGRLLMHGLSNAYTSIVTTRGEVLHESTSRHELSAGDLILCDVGGETQEGYAADVTRTWPVSGTMSGAQRDVYDLVLYVQKHAIERARSGVSYLDMHRGANQTMAEGLIQLGVLKGTADAAVESGAVSLFFPHGLGHMLGLDVHDMEDLGDRAAYGPEHQRQEHPALSALRLTRVLQPGMCVTIEPGFYQVPALLERAKADAQLNGLVNWQRLASFADVRGIRIEDDILVTAGEPEVLSAQAPKEPAAIKELICG